MALHAPFDVIVVRKPGVPFQPKLGMGAVGGIALGRRYPFTTPRGRNRATRRARPARSQVATTSSTSL